MKQLLDICQTAALLEIDAQISWPEKKADDGGVLIVRLDAIGDYMLFRPALRALRNLPAMEGKRITLCGNAVWQPLAETFDANSFDAFIPLSRGKFTSDIQYRHSLLRYLHEQNFSCALQPTFSRDYLGDSCIMAAGAPRSIGFDCPPQNISPRLLAFFNRCYTELVTPSEAFPFEVSRNIDFVKQLGADSATIPPFQETFPKNLCDYMQKIIKRHLGYPVFFMGASAPSKRWPVPFFAKLARRVAARFGKRVLLTGGMRVAEDIAAVHEKCRDFVIPLPETDLIELAALLAHAPLVVSNDSGGAHMGATWDAPTVIISNGQHRGRFHPYPQKIAPRVRTVYPAACRADSRNLYYTDAPYPIHEVTVADICEAIEGLLATD